MDAVSAFLADNIPYTLEAIQGMVESYNSLFWPLPLVAPLLLMPLLIGVGVGSRRLWKWYPPLLMAAVWTCCGQIYYLQFLEPLDWSAKYAAWLFSFQGLALALMPLMSGRGNGMTTRSVAFSGLFLMVMALAGSPLLQWFCNVHPRAIAVAGITPELTLLFTMGWLLRIGAAVWLWVIPALGSLYSFPGGLALGYIPAMLPLPALLIAITVMFVGLTKRQGTR